jgi:hypothetical protein
MAQNFSAAEMRTDFRFSIALSAQSKLLCFFVAGSGMDSDHFLLSFSLL